jgi:hypothetical protein
MALSSASIVPLSSSVSAFRLGCAVLRANGRRSVSAGVRFIRRLKLPISWVY